jgi:hypothetical protein
MMLFMVTPWLVDGLAPESYPVGRGPNP